jgi:hypothetical protein
MSDKTTTDVTQADVRAVAPAFDTIMQAYQDNPLYAKQEFRKFLNREPSAKWIVPSYDKKSKTIKIGDLQQLLDMVYFGQWSTKNFKFEVIANEIVGTVELHLIDPFSGATRQIMGAASVAIMVDKGTDGLDVKNKKSKALEMGFPKLYAMCFKSAARQIGTLFGRDINRDVVVEAADVVSHQDNVIDALIEQNGTTND